MEHPVSTASPYRHSVRSSVHPDVGQTAHEGFRRSFPRLTRMNQVVFPEDGASIARSADVHVRGCETADPSEVHGLRHLLGWGFSVVLHGLVIVAAVPFMLKVTMPTPEPRREPFRWEVSLLTAPLPEVVTADLPSSLSPAPPSNETIRVEDMESQFTEQNAVANRSEAFLDTEMPTQTSVESFRQTPVQEHSAQNSHPQPTFGASAGPVPFAESMEVVLPPPDVNVPQQTDQVQVHAETEHLTVVQRRLVERPVITRRILPHYGWLADALRDKIEQVKRYPHLAKINRWQGRVVVQMKVREDGHLVNLEIQESSGYEILDEAALVTLQDASPLVLAHRLDQAHVLISLPINYQLE